MSLLGNALLTMAVAQLFDLATFMAMIRRLGPGAELNPIVLGMLGSGGMASIVLAKVALVVLIGAVSVTLVQGRAGAMQRAATVLLGCAIVAGVFGGWTNAITIVRL
jgi:hypothetical protein